MRDDSGMNLNNGGDNSETLCMSTSSPEQVALFNLCYENGYDLFVDPDYVSWLLETHPEHVPADLMTGVNDPFQPFDNHASTNEISNFIIGSSGFPEWYEDMWIQEVTLLGDPDKDSIIPDVIELSTLSPGTPIVAVSTQPEESTISEMVTHKYLVASICGALPEVTCTPPTTSALSMSSDPSIMPEFATSSNSSDTVW